MRARDGGVLGKGVRTELSKISFNRSEGEDSWCEGKCGSERVSFVGGVLGFESERQEECRQSYRTSSFVGIGSAEASWRKKRRERGDVGFMVKRVVVL